MKVTDKPIIVEQTFDSPINQVWDALTNIDQMRQWYFNNIHDFKPQVGFKTQFIVRSEERTFPHIWEVVEVEHLKMIKYTWQYDGYLGKSTSAFELSDEDGKTKLTLTIEILEDFPEDIPEFRLESCIGGWDYFINDRLKNFLNTIDGR